LIERGLRRRQRLRHEVLDAEKIIKCLKALNIGDITEMGVTRSEAMKVVASLLIMEGFVPCTAQGEHMRYPSEVADEGGYFWQGLVYGFILGTLTTASLAFLLFKLLAVIRRETPQARPKTKDMTVQAPTTYARNRQDPRFVPLPDHSWGAW
jgi:hypothetical protein